MIRHGLVFDHPIAIDNHKYIDIYRYNYFILYIIYMEQSTARVLLYSNYAIKFSRHIATT